MNIIDQLHDGYGEFQKHNMIEPNVLIMGYGEKGELIRECYNSRNGVMCLSTCDGSLFSFMGCEIVECLRPGMRFARTGYIMNIAD